MTQDEIKAEVQRIYSAEYMPGRTENSVVGALPFFGWLQKQYPELVD